MNANLSQALEDLKDKLRGYDGLLTQDSITCSNASTMIVGQQNRILDLQRQANLADRAITRLDETNQILMRMARALEVLVNRL